MQTFALISVNEFHFSLFEKCVEGGAGGQWSTDLKEGKGNRRERAGEWRVRTIPAWGEMEGYTQEKPGTRERRLSPYLQLPNRSCAQGVARAVTRLHDL